MAFMGKKQSAYEEKFNSCLRQVRLMRQQDKLRQDIARRLDSLEKRAARAHSKRGRSVHRLTNANQNMSSSIDKKQGHTCVTPTNELPTCVVSAKEKLNRCLKCKGWGHYPTECPNTRVVTFEEWEAVTAIELPTESELSQDEDWVSMNCGEDNSKSTDVAQPDWESYGASVLTIHAVAQRDPMEGVELMLFQKENEAGKCSIENDQQDTSSNMATLENSCGNFESSLSQNSVEVQGEHATVGCVSLCDEEACLVAEFSELKREHVKEPKSTLDSYLAEHQGALNLEPIQGEAVFEASLTACGSHDLKKIRNPSLPLTSLSNNGIENPLTQHLLGDLYSSHIATTSLEQSQQTRSSKLVPFSSKDHLLPEEYILVPAAQTKGSRFESLLNTSSSNPSSTHSEPKICIKLVVYDGATRRNKCDWHGYTRFPNSGIYPTASLIFEAHKQQGVLDVSRSIGAWIRGRIQGGKFDMHLSELHWWCSFFEDLRTSPKQPGEIDA